MSLNGRVLLAAIACALVGACGDAPSETRKPQSGPNAAKPAEKTDALPQEMVAAVAAGKNATAVTVHFALGASPRVDQDLPVEIAIVPRKKFDMVRARFEPQGGSMTLTSGNDLAPLNEVQAEKILRHKMVLRPRQDGLFMVTATVETEDDQGTTTRVFFIPILVTAQAAGAPAPAATPPAG